MSIITDLFSRNRTKTTENAFQLNDVKTDISFGWNPFGIGNNNKEFSDFYLRLIFNQIYNGISNVTFTSRKNNLESNNIVTFIDRNASLLVNQMIFNGYMCVSYTNTGTGYKYYIPKQADIRKDGYGRVLNVDTVVVYSNVYQLQRKPDIAVVRPELELINTLCNTVVQSSDTMGVLPIIWGNSIPANPKFKEDLNEMMSKKYGWSEDKFRYFLSHQEVHIEEIDLKVKDLELRDNIEDTFSYLCRYFGVPTDLVLGNSTFNNVKESKIYFYDTTIRSWAEILLKVARSLLTATGDFIPQNDINYFFHNVPEMEKTLSGACQEKNAYIDTLIKLKDAGVDVNDELEKVYNDVKKLYIEV